MNRAEKEAYLREYGLHKSQGKPFFPYAVAKDSVMACFVMFTIILMSLTGYLLPFDQRSYWATIVANNITASGPLVGPYLADFLRAGPDFGATTLSRFYAIHMMLVPGAIAGLIGAHLYLVAKHGTTAPPWMKATPPQRQREDRA